MKNTFRFRTLLCGAAAIAVLAALATVPILPAAHAKGMAAGDVMVPKFEVDPFWPKPLPNHWRLAMVIGLSMDAHDNVWILHRPQTLEQKESYAARGEADCCAAAPDVLEFDPAGKLIRHWGRDEVKGNGHDWPSSNHGITVDKDGNVWIGGNGAYQPLPSPGSAAQFATPTGSAYAGAGSRHLSRQLHPEVHARRQIPGRDRPCQWQQGQPGHRQCARRRPDALLPGNELVLADGYGNKRVSVWDAATMKFKRMWGAYGQQARRHADPALRRELAAVRQSGALRPAVQ